MRLEEGAVRFLVAMSSLTYLRIVMVSGMWFISQPAVSSQVLSPWLVSVLSFVLKLFLRSPVLPVVCFYLRGSLRAQGRH